MEDTQNAVDTAKTMEETTFDDDLAQDAESRIYELGYHLVPALSEDEAPVEAAALKELVTKAGGTVIEDEAPQHISLAYTMFRTESGKKTKFDTAHFCSVKFEIDPAQITTIQEGLDENKNVLRYIIYKTVRENTRSEYRFPQKTDRKAEQKPVAEEKASEKPQEENEPVSEEALDKSINELVVE
ncbi:MAG: 30S ribosomal protein S6 [Candidatus Pacebacteria bacterium]|nr:30S ribosomal protein S6 [Candidatus Paceibacterota bacterium]